MRYFLIKLAIFIIAFAATCGIVAVDYSCAKASNRDTYIGLSASRQDEIITISGFGRETDINLEAVMSRAVEMKDRVKALEVWDYVSIE